ncbi:hypothetical protein EDD22DRAFT_987772 [Suillus occidentalis]|nr:hypothetical protein EDD22DRAFT_987772 [Suillus occidentalis]
MEYSSDDIAAARSLQIATYIYVSTATFWTYDYACSLHEEWTFLLRSHWSKVKGMYIVTRYLPFIFLIMDLYLNFTLNENPNKCRVLDNIGSASGIVSGMFSDFFFILRTYTLWNNSRIMLVAMLSTFFIFLVASLGISFATTVSSPYVTSAIPSITGCYQSSISLLFVPFLLFSIFQLGLVIATLIRAIQSWRQHPNHLYTVLVNNNISFYTCGFLISLTNVFTSLFLQYAYSSMLHNFQFAILAILATRLHLHLWRINQHAYVSSALMRTSMSDMLFANSTA